MSNNWKEIWNGKGKDYKISLAEADEFTIYKELKRLDGFDVSIENQEAYYKNFYDSAIKTYSNIKNKDGINSAYEVGCGSGANLYLLNNRGIKVGGIDYSMNLVKIAKSLFGKEKQIEIGDAIDLSTDEKYDMVFSESVFAYFPNEEYGEIVLQKMHQKARKLIVISEVFDKDMQSECERHRRELFDNYDEKYKGLDKVFYKREMFIQFAEKHNCRIKFDSIDNEYYWNSKYLFNCYLYKEE